MIMIQYIRIFHSSSPCESWNLGKFKNYQNPIDLNNKRWGLKKNPHRFYTHSLYKHSHKGVIIMPSKSDIEYQIKELKMDYMNLQGDIEKLESTGHNDQVSKAEQRLANMEAKLAELNKQLAEL